MEYIYIKPYFKRRFDTQKRLNALADRYRRDLQHMREAHPGAAIFEEASAEDLRSVVLGNLLRHLKRGDVLIVASLDRLGLRIKEILALISNLSSRRVVLKSMKEGFDTGKEEGKRFAKVLMSLVRMDRELISIRTKQAYIARKERGVASRVHNGISKERYEAARALRMAGKTYKEIAAETGISLSGLAKNLRDLKIDMRSGIINKS